MYFIYVRRQILTTYQFAAVNQSQTAIAGTTNLKKNKKTDKIHSVSKVL